MKEFTRFELATIKRIAQSTKTLRTKRNKLRAKIDELQGELLVINSSIESFEQPIREMTGGYTSEQVLSGEYETLTQPVQQETTPEEVETEEVEVVEEPSETLEEEVETPWAENKL